MSHRPDTAIVSMTVAVDQARRPYIEEWPPAPWAPVLFIAAQLSQTPSSPDSSFNGAQAWPLG